jgi:hypothetical protein
MAHSQHGDSKEGAEEAHSFHLIVALLEEKIIIITL